MSQISSVKTAEMQIGGDPKVTESSTKVCHQYLLRAQNSEGFRGASIDPRKLYQKRASYVKERNARE